MELAQNLLKCIHCFNQGNKIQVQSEGHICDTMIGLLGNELNGTKPIHFSSCLQSLECGTGISFMV